MNDAAPKTSDSSTHTRQLIQPTMDTQLTAAQSAFEASKFPRKLNLGCGTELLPDHLNIDMNAWYKPDVIADVRRLDFLPAQYYDEVLAQDVLEHLPRTETLRTLQHWNRCLRMGGRITVRVPSILGIAEKLALEENQGFGKQEQLMQCLFGTQAYTGDFHFTSFTETLIHGYFAKAGFRLNTIKLKDGWLFDAEGAKVSHFAAPTSRDFVELLEIEGEEDFVTTCYREILGRPPDQEGLHFFRSGLNGGSMSRSMVIGIMSGSDEHQSQVGAQ